MKKRIQVRSDYLGGHVEGASQHGLSFVVGSKQFRKAEVSNFYMPVMLEDVRQLEISVHDFAFHERLKGIQNLEEVLYGFFFVDVLLRLH